MPEVAEPIAMLNGSGLLVIFSQSALRGQGTDYCRAIGGTTLKVMRRPDLSGSQISLLPSFPQCRYPTWFAKLWIRRSLPCALPNRHRY